MKSLWCGTGSGIWSRIGLVVFAFFGVANVSSASADEPPVVVLEVYPTRSQLVVYEDEGATFDAGRSYDPDGGDIVSFEWYVNGQAEGWDSSFRWKPSIEAGTEQEIRLKIVDSSGLWTEDIRVYTVSPVSKRFYYLKDHMGSVRATIDDFGNVVHYSDYYPFGKEMPGRVLENESPAERFTGHQQDVESGLTYAGARYYDPEVMRWTSPDPLAADYPGWSPYNYTLNNPVNNYDPDGNLVVFINGFYIFANPFTGPNLVNYWGSYGETFMSFYPGEEARYEEGSLGGAYGLSKIAKVFGHDYGLFQGNRYDSGYQAGLEQAAEIAAQLEKGETVKIVSHSMGGAYGAGYGTALQDKGIDVEFHLAIAPFQSRQIDRGKVQTYQVGDLLDPVSWIPNIDGAESLDKNRGWTLMGWMRFLNPVHRHSRKDYDPKNDKKEIEKKNKEEK